MYSAVKDLVKNISTYLNIYDNNEENEEITYTVEDSSGNKATVTRTVIVKGKDNTGGNTTEGNTTGGENNNTVENKVNNE